MVGVLFVGAGLCAGPLVRGLWGRGGTEAAPPTSYFFRRFNPIQQHPPPITAARYIIAVSE